MAMVPAEALHMIEREQHDRSRAHAMERDQLATAARHEIEQRDKKITSLTIALTAAREKLVLYRSERGGEYTGGMEYSELMRLIDKALSRS